MAHLKPTFKPRTGQPKHRFTPQLGPARDYPEGSQDWHEANALPIWSAVERLLGQNDHLVRVMKTALNATVKPWDAWPKASPCGSIDAWYELCTGNSYAQFWAMMNALYEDHNFPAPRCTRAEDRPPP